LRNSIHGADRNPLRDLPDGGRSFVHHRSPPSSCSLSLARSIGERTRVVSKVTFSRSLSPLDLFEAAPDVAPRLGGNSERFLARVLGGADHLEVKGSLVPGSDDPLQERWEIEHPEAGHLVDGRPDLLVFAAQEIAEVDVD